jgi:membrane associated rhomboid family serine protease
MYRQSNNIFTNNATIPIIGMNLVVFILQAVLGPWFTESFMLVSSDVLFRPWILLTSMFLHGSLSHLIFNMYALLIFGPLIEQRIGIKRFIILYFTAGILASLGSTLFYHAALGASGAIMGVLGITIMLLPHLRVLFFFFIPMSLRTAGIIIIAIDLMGAFGIGLPGIANIAHLVGLACGLGYGLYLLKQKRRFATRFVDRPGKRAKRVRHKVHKEKSIDMSKEEVDDYLKHGRL